LYSGYLETQLHWNNKISIDDLNADIIIRATSMFVELKLDKFNEILFVKKLLNMSLWKQNKFTLKGRSSTTPHTCRWMNPVVKGPSFTLWHHTRWGSVMSQYTCLSCLFLVIIVARRTSSNVVPRTCNWFFPRHLHKFWYF